MIKQKFIKTKHRPKPKLYQEVEDFMGLATYGKDLRVYDTAWLWVQGNATKFTIIEIKYCLPRISQLIELTVVGESGIVESKRLWAFSSIYVEKPTYQSDTVVEN